MTRSGQRLAPFDSILAKSSMQRSGTDDRDTHPLQMSAMLKAHGVHNYSISLHPASLQLFAYAEIESEAKWEAIASTEVCQRWWAHMASKMETDSAGL
jgi:L-rhamnose mutarotase